VGKRLDDIWGFPVTVIDPVHSRYRGPRV